MKIRNYPINQNLTDRDMLLGTDSNGLTKNFLLSDISEFITSGISISGTFTPAKDISGNPLTTNIIAISGTHITSAMPVGTKYRLAWSGVGPFAYRTGTSATVATSGDILALPGNVDIQNFGTDQYISIYGFDVGQCNITAGS